jgi:hypothetical protein
MEIATQTEPIAKVLTSKEKELKRKREWSAKKRREQGTPARIPMTEEQKAEKLKEVYAKKAEYNRKRREAMAEDAKQADLQKRKEKRDAKPVEVKHEEYVKQYTKRKETWTPEQHEAYNAKRREAYHKKKNKEVIATAI